MTVRPARAVELPVLQRIEVDAGSLFASIGMVAVARHAPPPLSELGAYQRDGRAWVSVDSSDQPVGYALAFELDAAAHLEQLSVRPQAGRQGRGRALIEAVAHWGQLRGLRAMTLSTFRDVSWNAPYYERCGFRVLAEAELTPGLLRLRRHEAERGLDTATRAFMRRDG